LLYELKQIYVVVNDEDAFHSDGRFGQNVCFGV
jgi:hypothetical protein